MKRIRTQKLKRSLPHFHPIISVLTLVLGILGTLFVTHVFAQTANTTLYACTQNATGLMRYVTNTTSCRPGETLISWTSGGNTTWGSITGTLSNQTDLQNALNTKQDELVSFHDIHHKSLKNNADNDLFTLPLANGESASIIVRMHFTAKKGSDWASEVTETDMVLYNDGGVLRHSGTDFYGTDEVQSNSNTLELGNGNWGTPTISNGIVTIKWNTGNVGVSPDSINLDYTVLIPSGQTLTFIP